MPAIHRDLAGDQGGAAAVAVFDDFQHVVALLGAERFEAPIIEDQQLDAAEGAHQPRVAAVATGQREIAEHPRNALVQHRAVVAACFVAEGASQPAFADTGRPFDDQVLRLVDPAAGDQGLEQGAVETAGGTVRASGREAWLVTNAHHHSLSLKLAHTPLTDLCDRILCSHDFREPKESAAFWPALRAREPFDPARALFVDDSESVLKAAQAYGIGQLLTIGQPDSSKPARHDLAFPVLHHFRDLLPIPPRHAPA